MTPVEILQLVRNETPAFAKLTAAQIASVLERRVYEWAAAHHPPGGEP